MALIKAGYRLGEAKAGPPGEFTARMFRAAQWARSSNAAAAMQQMAARSAKSDPRLSQLARARQDLVAEWQVKDQLMVSARSGAATPPISDLARRLTEIQVKIEEIDRTFATAFPDYAEIVRIEPMGIDDVQRLLGNNEALVAIVDTPYRAPLPAETFVWVVTKTDVRWLRSDFGPSTLQREVAALRCGLDAAAWSGEGARRCADLLQLPLDKAPKEGEPLPYDVARAHKLYVSLFGEMADRIKGKHLLIVPSGPLTTLPIQALVTAPPASKDLASARWLVHDHAVTVLPSVASLAALRRTAKPSAATKPMIGFGNPLLDGNQAHPQHGAYFEQQAQIARAQTGCALTARTRTATLRMVARSVTSVPQTGSMADLKHLRMQAPLPETADELCEVARAVGGSVVDVLIGARATETEVKRLSSSGELAKYRMLHFATHGTLAGQLSGTNEPGLILSPPKTATAEDDGYLSGSEIAGLKLDADWVILSACNTAGGAGHGEAAEALSGLARVFFYAGARALLVSHWEVDSDAAVKLVTGAIGAIAKDKSVGRAEALRRAMLATMADTSRPANWIPAWHPSVWAPFGVVGEGGGGGGR